MLVTCMWQTLKVSCMYVTRIMYRDWLESNTNSHSNSRLSVFFPVLLFSFEPPQNNNNHHLQIWEHHGYLRFLQKPSVQASILP